MIGVSDRPCSSSAARSAPTRPSIMSLGATASAPASAWETAVRASSSSVWSLSTTPSSRSTPQWPCDVYSHRQRSVMTNRSGCAALIARVASWMTPSSSHAPEPSSSLARGQAEQQHGRDAERVRDRRPPRRRRRSRGGRCPGSSAIGVRFGAVGDHEHRIDEVRDRELGLAHEAAQHAGLAQAAQAGGGEGHPRNQVIPARGAAAAAASVAVAELGPAGRALLRAARRPARRTPDSALRRRRWRLAPAGPSAGRRGGGAGRRSSRAGSRRSAAR